MPKLILHIVVALAVWFALAHFGVPWGYRLGAIVAGAVLVHLVWIRFIFNPYVYLGAMPVADDDPLITAARQKARDTFGQFLTLYQAYSQGAMVKFRGETDRGRKQDQWGKLLEINDRKARVGARSQNLAQEIPTERIIDWQIDMPDGTIRGGYTNRALFEIYEREAGSMHPKLLAVYRRFRDANDAGD